MKYDTSWPAPTGRRLDRARTAWNEHAQDVWAGRAASFDNNPGWVQEIWAQVAEAALADDPATGARAAHAKRVELEGRSETWDALPPLGRSIWTAVATSVRAS